MGRLSHDRSSLERGGSKFQRDGKHDILSQSPDLAKLSPKCHMNYSIIFKESSFYLETLNLYNKLL